MCRGGPGCKCGCRLAPGNKLDTGVAVQYFLLLADKTVGRVLPIGFAVFVVMGSFGALVHLAALWGLYRLLGRGFSVSQGTAALCAMSLKFFLNNKFTYSDRRLRGAAMFQRGLVFLLVCGIGATTSVQLAAYLLGHGIPWWLAGLCGAGVGAVWNYLVSSHIWIPWIPARFRLISMI